MVFDSIAILSWEERWKWEIMVVGSRRIPILFISNFLLFKVKIHRERLLLPHSLPKLPKRRRFGSKKKTPKKQNLK